MKWTGEQDIYIIYIYIAFPSKFMAIRYVGSAKEFLRSFHFAPTLFLLSYFLLFFYYSCRKKQIPHFHLSSGSRRREYIISTHPLSLIPHHIISYEVKSIPTRPAQRTLPQAKPRQTYQHKHPPPPPR